MQDEVAEPPADDGAGDDPDGDERDVVGAKATRPRQQAHEQQDRHDDGSQGDRRPAHLEVAEQVGIRIELEGHDGDLHGAAECTEGGVPAPRSGSRSAQPGDEVADGGR